MIISSRDGIKLFGVAIVVFCAVFVCTFMFNFYLDAIPLQDTIGNELIALYDAQRAMASMCCSITGGCIAPVVAVMLVFYIKLYADEHAEELGTLKALGYSGERLARSFVIFGSSVFVGCLIGVGCGYAATPLVYDELTVGGLSVGIGFHIEIAAVLILAPTAAFSALAYIVARIVLNRPALEIMHGKSRRTADIAVPKRVKNSGRPFMHTLIMSTMCSNKQLTFFITFSCFCFATTLQMGISMFELSGACMGYIMIGVGIIIATASAVMALAALIKNNGKTIALMKTSGYTLGEISTVVFVGFIPFAALGFALGTVYQYGLMSLIVNLTFADVDIVPSYDFDVDAMFTTLAAFIVCYVAISALYIAKLKNASVKAIMLENR